MKVIGINVQHDGGCCIIVDGSVACAISEERLTRRKTAGGWWYALRYCLESTKLTLSEIDLVVFSSYGDRLPDGFDGGLSAFGLKPGRVISIDHHLSHAASAFWSSSFDEALIVVIDGLGNDGDTESFFLANGCGIERLGGNSNRQPGRGVGKTYEAFTSFLGWPMIESASTMALAAYGDPDRYRGLELFRIRGDQIDSRLSAKYLHGVIDFARSTGVNFGAPFDEGRHQISRDVARFVQDRTERALVEYIKVLVDRTGARNLCLAGGLALNCVANEKIRTQCGIDQVFIPPFASDKGQALGNALYGQVAIRGGDRPPALKRDSFGRMYGADDILPVLNVRQELGNNFIVKASRFEYARTDQIAAEVARLLAAGKTVGWVQGGSEAGPRALGHRSILADPRSKDRASHISKNVKKRAWFRPYSPAVLHEEVSSYFDLDVSSPFMLLAPRVVRDKQSQLSGVVHVDGTSRPQTVAQEAEPLFHQLLSEFKRSTGLPLVLNTSFNRAGEPIVETPKDALSSFLSSELDYLAIEDFLVWKNAPIWANDF